MPGRSPPRPTGPWNPSARPCARTSAPEYANDALQKIMFWVAAGSVVIGVAARVVACLDDLWFDEVWSVLIVRDYVHSPLDVFTNFKHSNNNHLNSLWLWLMGYGAWPPLYRVPSLIASVGTIALAGLIGGRPSAGGGGGGRPPRGGGAGPGSGGGGPPPPLRDPGPPPPAG